MCLSIDVEFDALGHVILPGLIDWPAKPIDGAQQPDQTFIDSPRSYCAARPRPASVAAPSGQRASCPAKAGHPVIAGLAIWQDCASNELSVSTASPAFAGDETPFHS